MPICLSATELSTSKVLKYTDRDPYDHESFTNKSYAELYPDNGAVRIPQTGTGALTGPSNAGKTGAKKKSHTKAKSSKGRRRTAHAQLQNEEFSPEGGARNLRSQAPAPPAKRHKTSMSQDPFTRGNETSGQGCSDGGQELVAETHFLGTRMC